MAVIFFGNSLAVLLEVFVLILSDYLLVLGLKITCSSSTFRIYQIGSKLKVEYYKIPMGFEYV